MDTALIEAAIRKAIAKGASKVRPMYNPPHDLDVVRTYTDVGMNPEDLAAYVLELRRDPEMERFDEKFATLATGGGTRITLHLIAKLLLADAILTKDIAQTVARFRSYVQKNRAPVMAVMAVRGVRSYTEVALGPDIRLVTVKSLPPSIQRGALMGQACFLIPLQSPSQQSPP
jgi:hypothetical protein